MPNLFVAAGFRGAALISFSWIATVIATTPVSGQVFSGNPYDQSRMFGSGSVFSTTSFPDSWEHTAPGPATVSSDVLRHPLEHADDCRRPCTWHSLANIRPRSRSCAKRWPRSLPRRPMRKIFWVLSMSKTDNSRKHGPLLKKRSV